MWNRSHPKSNENAIDMLMRSRAEPIAIANLNIEKRPSKPARKWRRATEPFEQLAG
jgi:hypothetical protein